MHIEKENNNEPEDNHESQDNQDVEVITPEDHESEEQEEPELDPLQQEIESLKQQVKENEDKALRIAAEMDNLRKRTLRDVENAHKFALEKFIKELLPVVDSMELGISASDNAEDIISLKEGMDLTLKMFQDNLGKSGIEVVDPQGDKFNPELHEAVSMTDAEDTESGNVVAVMQKGYSLNGRLIRPAMVIVSK
jgi:molecular chaperone GrpE